MIDSEQKEYFPLINGFSLRINPPQKKAASISIIIAYQGYYLFFPFSHSIPK